MSELTKHLSDQPTLRSTTFYKARPQVLRSVIMALDRAVSSTVAALRNVRAIEPRFTRQLAASLEVARDLMPGSTRYDITHQPELPIVNDEGVVVAHRRLDIRILFRRQLGRTGDYLAIECKYLDTTDRATDADYVDEGVE